MDNYKLGATETRESNRVYLNLRTGKLSETSKEDKPGFKPFTTKNASGQEYHFFAKTYDDLTAYIKDVQWHEFEYEGKKIVGWNIILDTFDKEYCLQINSSDRPYQTIMSVLPNVDFTKPVRVVAFLGKSSAGKPQKVLLFTQNLLLDTREWVKAKYEPKWLSRLLANKVKEGVPLSDDEERNVAFLPDGKPDKDFPYIREKSDGTWSFDAWTDFLLDKMHSEVIPAVKAATENRTAPEREYSGTDDFDNDFISAGSLGGNDDDEIPF